jgi:ketosteroid isomerase-like protein
MGNETESGIGGTSSATAAADIEARIVGYFDACTSGDGDAVASHFADDAVVYDTNHAPVRGAATIGRFWSRIAAKWQGAAWRCERLVTDGDTAAIEWKMSGTIAADSDGDVPFAVRGSEHYDFGPPGDSGGRLIAEIRQYWTFDAEHPSSELVDYPYGQPDRLGS